VATVASRLHFSVEMLFSEQHWGGGKVWFDRFGHE